jgi:hypothetical protein
MYERGKSGMVSIKEKINRDDGRMAEEEGLT